MNAPDPLANLSPAAQRLERASQRARLKKQAKANRAAAPVASARALIEALGTLRLSLVEDKRIVALLTEIRDTLTEIVGLVNDLQAKTEDGPVPQGGRVGDGVSISGDGSPEIVS